MTTYSQRQQAAMEAVKQAVATLADIGHTESQEHSHALSRCREELGAIEIMCRQMVPSSTAVGTPALVADVIINYDMMCDILANDLDKETIALLEESITDIAHRSPARGKRMRAHLGKLQARIRKAAP